MRLLSFLHYVIVMFIGFCSRLKTELYNYKQAYDGHTAHS